MVQQHQHDGDNKEDFSVIFLTMIKHIDIIRWTIRQSDDMYVFGHCMEKIHRTIDL